MYKQASLPTDAHLFKGEHGEHKIGVVGEWVEGHALGAEGHVHEGLEGGEVDLGARGCIAADGLTDDADMANFIASNLLYVSLNVGRQVGLHAANRFGAPSGEVWVHVYAKRGVGVKLSFQALGVGEESEQVARSPVVLGLDGGDRQALDLLGGEASGASRGRKTGICAGGLCIGCREHQQKAGERKERVHG